MSFETLHYVNMFIGLGAIVLQILALVALVLLVCRVKDNFYLAFIKKHFIQIGFVIALSALMVSAFYSEVLEYVPCFHCWVQRIFIFPQVFIFAVAWFRKDRSVLWYSVPLTLIGLLDAIYLNYIYYFNPNAGPCDASGVSCVQNLVSEFNGYISIPSLALTGFLALVVLLAVTYFYKNDK